MKKKIAKILFIASFLPYIIIVLLSLYIAIVGNDVYEKGFIDDSFRYISGPYIRTEYGMTVFLDYLKGFIVIFGIWIPILPVVVIYQIIYLIMKVVKKKQNLELEEEK